MHAYNNNNSFRKTPIKVRYIIDGVNLKLVSATILARNPGPSSGSNWSPDNMPILCQQGES